MPKCESTLDTPLLARTATGPSITEVTCEIGTRLDIKHFVSMVNLRNFPVDVSCFARIQSDPRIIRFEAVEPEEGRQEAKVSHRDWSAVCLLDKDERKTFGVALFSDQADGSEQNIEVKLVINRLHEGREDSLEFPTITVSS